MEDKKMTLIKWNNSKTNNLVDRNYFPSLISDFFGTMPYDDFDKSNIKHSMPAVNVRESDNNFAIELAAPGLQKSDFNISVKDGILNISAEKKLESNEKNESYTRREFMYSSFKRSFSLPDTVNHDAIDAAYTDGVLLINLPKKEEAKPKPLREVKVS